MAKSNRLKQMPVPCRPLVFLVVFLTVGPGCTRHNQVEQDHRGRQTSQRVVAASYALQYLTSRIAGEDVQVDCPIDRHVNALAWSPDPDQIADLQQADLMVINGQGAEYARWTVRVTLSPSRLCESCEDITLKSLISVPDHRIVHTHGPEGEHSHPYMVPYTWLDPAMAVQQAEKIADCLTRVYPERDIEFADNLKQLIQDLQTIQVPGKAADGKPLRSISLNPHLKYFCRAAGLVDQHLLWFDLPAVAQWSDAQAELEDKIAATDPDLILVSQPLPDHIRDFLASVDLSIVQVDLLDHQPENGDLITQLQANFDQLGE